MERLGSLFWSGVTLVALLGMVSSIAAPIALASPIVKITQPGHEQVVRGEIVIDVSFRSDSDQPITRIDLLIDGDTVSQYALNPPKISGKQSFKWTFNSPAGSSHSVSARAVDAAGEIGMATITVTVAAAESSPAIGQDRIPPVINIYYPAQGAELEGEVEIKAEANDNNGVMAVFFYLDGKFHTAIMNTGPYTARWDTAKMPDGAHVIQARAMDDAENESASAEVTVFVKNHDMTTASPEALAPTAASRTQAPSVGLQDQPVTQSQFATPSEPMMAMATGGIDAEGANVGYVPAIGAQSPGARTSAPRMLSGLPRDLQPQAEPAHGPASRQGGAEVVGVATTHEPVEEHQIASNELTPRLTVPRRMAATSSHTVTPMSEAQRAMAPVGPQVAAAEALQRTTLPRTQIERMPSVDEGVALRPGWVELEPVLQLTPDRDMLAARTTTPGLTLQPTEQLAAGEAGVESLLVAREPLTEFGSVVAKIDSRTTTPERMLSHSEVTDVAEKAAAPQQVATAPVGSTSAPAIPDARLTVPDRRPVEGVRLSPSDLSGFRPLEGDTRTMRIAVLPERASRAAIPADGRLTRPGEPVIAPVASMAFNEVKVLFDNQTLELLAQPEMKQGISLAPLREIFEHSDGVLYWYPVEKRVRATRPGTDMSLQIGDPNVQINNETRTLQVAPYIKQGRTMVPLQFLADTLDVTVTFNPDTGQICLTSNEF